MVEIFESEELVYAALIAVTYAILKLIVTGDLTARVRFGDVMLIIIIIGAPLAVILGLLAYVADFDIPSDLFLIGSIMVAVSIWVYMEYQAKRNELRREISKKAQQDVPSSGL